MAEADTPPRDSDDPLGVLLLGRTGQGKSSTGNKLLKAGGESVLREYEIEEFEVGGGGESCTQEIRSVFRGETTEAKAVEVVDTPGFAGSNTDDRLGVYRANLAMFRDLIRKKINDQLQIHRVLYFLPCRGPLECADAILQEEIRVMHHFFGNAIFDRMVLVATLHQRKQLQGFDEQDEEDTKRIFEKALMLASTVGDLPQCPPIIFIELNCSGKELLKQIESAQVASNEGLILNQFVQGCCSRCAAKYLCHEGDPNDPENQIGVAVPFKSEEEKSNEEAFFPYQSSKCHPQFIAKYRSWAKVVGGVAHIATLGIPLIIQKLRKSELPWPTFTSDDEICPNCRKGPGIEGCMDVHTKYKATKHTGEVVDMIVNHTNLLEDDCTKYLDSSSK